MAYEALQTVAYEYSEQFIEGLEYGIYASRNVSSSDKRDFTKAPMSIKCSADYFYVEPVDDFERQAGLVINGQVDVSGCHGQMVAIEREEAATHLGTLVGYFETK